MRGLYANLHNFKTCITFDSVGILRWGFVDAQISHFANFTPCEELVPKRHFWKVLNLRMVNFDNFGGSNICAQISHLSHFNCEELVRILVICEGLVRFFSDVKNWYSIFTYVKNRYHIFTRNFPALNQKSPKILNLKLKD